MGVPSSPPDHSMKRKSTNCGSILRPILLGGEAVLLGIFQLGGDAVLLGTQSNPH